MSTERIVVPFVNQTHTPGVSQDTVVLNDFSGVTFDERTRTTPNGTATRYTLSIEAQPIVMSFNGLELGREPAEAIRALIERQHGAIGQVASPGTLAKRDAEKLAYARGDAKTVAKYSGGRIGATPPVGRSAARFGIHSGRLKGGYFVRQNTTEGAWTVNVPANRFDPSTFGGGLAALQVFVSRLVQLVPALTGKGVMDDPDFARAVGRSSPVRAVLRGTSDWRTFARAGWKSVLAFRRAAGL